VAAAFAAGAAAVFLLVTDSEGYENLRRYHPDGHHFIDAIRRDGKITWTSQETFFGRVRKSSREFDSLDSFRMAFEKAKVTREADIDVHFRALNLEKEEGRKMHDRAQALLEFFKERGYPNAGSVSD
jgi:hypothetical protein